MKPVLLSGGDRSTSILVIGLAVLAAGLAAVAALASWGASPSSAGLVAYASDGDIYVGDPLSGVTTPVVSGPDRDSRPQWSPDGSKLVFVRAIDADREVVMVSGADGEDPIVLTPEPLVSVASVAVSSDSQQVVIEAERAETPALAVVGLDGRGFRWLDTGVSAGRPTMVPGDQAVVFVTGIGGDAGEGVASLDIGTGAVVTLIDPVASAQIVGYPSVSPDGSRVAFSQWVPGQNRWARVYTVAADGSDEPELVPPAPGICCEGSPAWSTDGSRLALLRWYGSSRVLAIVPWQSGGVGTEIALDAADHGRLAWSPDDRFVLAALVADREGNRPLVQQIFEVASARPVAQRWLSVSDPAWSATRP